MEKMAVRGSTAVVASSAALATLYNQTIPEHEPLIAAAQLSDNLALFAAEHLVTLAQSAQGINVIRSGLKHNDCIHIIRAAVQHAHILAESEIGFELLINDIFSSDLITDEGYKILENEHASIELIIKLCEHDATEKFIYSLINYAPLRNNQPVQHKILELLQIAPETIAVWLAPLCIKSDCNDCTDIIFDRFPLGFTKALLHQLHPADFLNKLKYNNGKIFDAILELFQGSTTQQQIPAGKLITILLHICCDGLTSIIPEFPSHLSEWLWDPTSGKKFAQLIANLMDKAKDSNQKALEAIFKHLQNNRHMLDLNESMDILATILLHACHEDLIPLITTILSHLHTYQPQSDSFMQLAQLIADFIILYKLNINIEAVTINLFFAQAILQAKENLLKSYGHHNTSSINEIKKLIATELEKKALSHGISTFHVCSGTRIIESTTQKAAPAISYIERKLIALGYNVPPIKAIFDGFSIDSDITLNIDTYDIIQRYGPLKLNAALSHEMAHYNGYHCAHRGAAKDRHAASIYLEGFADIQACIQAGPEVCRNDALSYINSGAPNNPNSDEHAPAPVRTAVLLDLARILEEGTFDPDQPSPLTIWLNTPGAHPDPNEFAKRYFTCEDGCKRGTRVIIAPHEADPERRYYVELRAPYHQWMEQARGFEA